MANADIDVVRARNLLDSIADRLLDIGTVDFEDLDHYVGMALDDIFGKLSSLGCVLEGKKHV